MDTKHFEPKGYTDLPQCKKLADILPLERADMVLLHEEPYETSDSKFDGLHQALCVPFKQYDKSWRHYNDVRNDWIASCTMEHSTRYETGRALNPIDACYEMILKLHERKLL